VCVVWCVWRGGVVCGCYIIEILRVFKLIEQIKKLNLKGGGGEEFQCIIIFYFNDYNKIKLINFFLFS